MYVFVTYGSVTQNGKIIVGVGSWTGLFFLAKVKSLLHAAIP